MPEIRVVSSNPHKAKEIISLLAEGGVQASHLDIGYPEVRAESVQEVAKEAALHLMRKGVSDFLLDDSCLSIRALRGFPGVYSSYVNRTIGCRGILALLAGEGDRSAEFISAVAGSVRGRLVEFTGRCPGRIVSRQRGGGGFGFDPIFVPVGESRTFAEMSPGEKHRVSHRGRAIREFVKWYRSIEDRG